MQTINTRRFIVLSAAGAALGKVLAQEPASKFPKDLIRIVVPYPPGGGADGTVRRVADILSKKLGVPVLVENKPGANTMIANEYVARQPADGYTLIYIDSAFTINPSLYKLRYSPVSDFTPIAVLGEIPLVVLASTALKETSLQSVLDHAKANPGGLTYASYGQGSRGHLFGQMLCEAAGVRMLHVPFKGTADALVAVVSKQVDLGISTIENALPLIRSGKVKVLAVSSASRASVLPEVPTVSESIKGLSTVGWGGLAGPRGLQPEVLRFLANAINEALQSPEMRERFTKQGVESVNVNPEVMAAMIKSEVEKWGAVVKKAGITLD